MRAGPPKGEASFFPVTYGRRGHHLRQHQQRAGRFHHFERFGRQRFWVLAANLRLIDILRAKMLRHTSRYRAHVIANTAVPP
jgi:hypothetical protein